MSVLSGQFPRAAEQVRGDAVGKMEVWRDRDMPCGRLWAGPVRRALDLTLTLVLVLLLAMPSLALAAAVPRFTPFSASDVPGDEYWAAGFNLPGMNGDVMALAGGPDGSLYAGGQFTTAGGIVANRIARWDGSRWHPLGSGMDGSVSALALGPDGSLYAGGSFTTAGGVAGNRIARWDGSRWHPLGSGMEGGDPPYIGALALGPNGSLYAGGRFDTAGGVAANSIARWDGCRWHPLGDGMGEVSYPDVSALMLGSDGSLYVGGRFSTAGGIAANGIARWDGDRWYPLDSGMNGGVGTLAMSMDGSLYAGGSFTTAGGAAASRIARWNGSQWHPLGRGMGETYYPNVYALTVGPDGSLYAGGGFTTAGGVATNGIARWDGSQWHPLGSGMGRVYYPNVQALAFGLDGLLYAGGGFTTAGEAAANSIARWDGFQWHPLSMGSGMGGDSPHVNVLAVSPDHSLYAGGSFTMAGEVAANRIARWDGSQWHPLGSGMDWGVYALTVGLDGSLYAGGSFTTAGGAAAIGIARWDGSQWHPLGSEMGGDPVSGASVSALAVGFDGSLYAGGWFHTGIGIGVPDICIARWDGLYWHPLVYAWGGCGINALVLGLDGSLYAGGDFAAVGGVAANSIARWDGAQWHALGSGMDGDVRALALGPDGSLYAGGDFTAAGGFAVNHIARWDGAQWHPLGNGMEDYSYVNALAVNPDGSLYAGGSFTMAGGVAANRIARWDGSQWHALGSGTDGSVGALAFAPDGSLYVGGHFTTAGNKPSWKIAQWIREVLMSPVAWFPVVHIEQ